MTETHVRRFRPAACRAGPCSRKRRSGRRRRGAGDRQPARAGVLGRGQHPDVVGLPAGQLRRQLHPEDRHQDQLHRHRLERGDHQQAQGHQGPRLRHRLADHEPGAAMGWPRAAQPLDMGRIPIDKVNAGMAEKGGAIWDFGGKGTTWIPHHRGTESIAWRTDKWQPEGEFPSYGAIWDDANAGKTMGRTHSLLLCAGLYLERVGEWGRARCGRPTRARKMRPVWEKVTDWCVAKPNIKDLVERRRRAKERAHERGRDRRPDLGRAADRAEERGPAGDVPRGAERLGLDRRHVDPDRGGEPRPGVRLHQHCYDAEAAGKAIDTHGYNSPVLGPRSTPTRSTPRTSPTPTRATTKLNPWPARSALVRRRPRPVRQQVPERLSQGRASTPGSHAARVLASREPGACPRAGTAHRWSPASVSSSRTSGVQFGGFVAVRDTVRIEPGEFFSFLGPPAAARPRSCAPSRASSSRRAGWCGSTGRTWPRSGPTAARPR